MKASALGNGCLSEIDRLLACIAAEMDLDGETEHEILAEMRCHLEEAVARGQAEGLDEAQALAQAAACFGVGQEIGRAMQATHAGWGTADAVMAAALPVVCSLILRWLIYAPDGTVLGWPELLSRPALWLVALVALLVPALKFERWRYALAAWAIFWALTLLFVALPAMRW